MNRLLTSRLAAHAEIRQVEASRLADAAADAVDAAFVRQWRQILRSLKTPVLRHARDGVLRGLIGILPVAQTVVSTSLYKIAKWGHATTRRNLQTTIPLGYLRSAAAGVLNESLLEDSSPGTLELILRGLGSEETDAALEVTSNLADALFADNPDDQRQAFMDMLFPPPPRETVDDVVYAKVNGLSWVQRIEYATRTSATPQQLAEIVAQGVAAGETQQQIAKRLLPVVDGVRSSARRIARTEGLRVAQEMQVRAWDGLGDMLLGYQVRAVLDERTRVEHRLRNGTIYYRDPKLGQKGMDECPRPPLEADGSYSWNCRCTLAPCMAPPDYLDASAFNLFKDNVNQLVPDPLTYSDWFSRATPRARRAAVGTRRYSAAREVLGHEPGYEHFVDPDAPDGSLLSLDQIRSESVGDRGRRLHRVHSAIKERGQLIRRVQLLGLFE
jgi:SPP1 gp7 family putative phage head morphogenesis protein